MSHPIWLLILIIVLFHSARKLTRITQQPDVTDWELKVIDYTTIASVLSSVLFAMGATAYCMPQNSAAPVISGLIMGMMVNKMALIRRDDGIARRNRYQANLRRSQSYREDVFDLDPAEPDD